MKKIISAVLAMLMMLQTVVFANASTFSSSSDNHGGNHKETPYISHVKDASELEKSPVFDGELEQKKPHEIPVRTLRKRIDPKTDKYEMARPGEGEVRVITTYKNTLAGGNGRSIGGKHRAMNVSRSNLNVMLAGDDIVMVEKDHLVYRTSTTTVNNYYDTTLSVMIGNFYPSSFDNLAVEEYHNNEIFGTGVKIAIFDSGLNVKSTELNIVGGATFVDGSDSFADDNGHGTAMAGIIGAAMDNEGITGIAPNAELYAVKVLDSTGVGYTSSVIEGIYWAVENDIDIICFGFAAEEYSNALAEAVAYAKNNGILMIAPAGNDGTSTAMYPAGYNEVISVGSVNNEGTISAYSNTGSTVDFYAPGENIDSILYANNKPTPFGGTSASAAHAAGFAALLLEENKENAEFNAFEYFTSNAVETELGFVDNTETEAKTMSAEAVSLQNEIGTFAVQKSLSKIATLSDEDINKLTSSEATKGITYNISFGESYTGRLDDAYDFEYYCFETEYILQEVKFNSYNSRCRIFYEDPYSGTNIDVTGASLVLPKGKHYIHVGYDYSWVFTPTNYVLRLTLLSYDSAENTKNTRRGVNAATGDFGYTFDDLTTVVAGNEFVIQRQYDTGKVIDSPNDDGWAFNYNKTAKLVVEEQQGGKTKEIIKISIPDGTVLRFEKRTLSNGKTRFLPENTLASMSTFSALTEKLQDIRMIRKPKKLHRL